MKAEIQMSKSSRPASSLLSLSSNSSGFIQTSYLSIFLHQHIFKILTIYPQKTRKSRHLKPKVLHFWCFYSSYWNYIPIFICICWLYTLSMGKTWFDIAQNWIIFHHLDLKHIHKVNFYPSDNNFTQPLLVMLVTNMISSFISLIIFKIKSNFKMLRGNGQCCWWQQSGEPSNSNF